MYRTIVTSLVLGLLAAMTSADVILESFEILDQGATTEIRLTFQAGSELQGAVHENPNYLYLVPVQNIDWISTTQSDSTLTGDLTIGGTSPLLGYIRNAPSSGDRVDMAFSSTLQDGDLVGGTTLIAEFASANLTPSAAIGKEFQLLWGYQTADLATPQGDPVTATPEPASVCLLAIGGAVLLKRQRK